MATDIEDVIDSLEDALSAARSVRDFAQDESNGKAAALDAIAQIRRGEYSNAITTLEREFLPKWQSTEACRTAYRKAPLVGALAVPS